MKSITMLMSMAFRNLLRHRVKSVLTITAVTVSVAVYIFVDGWLSGINIESRRNIVNFETGAAKLQSRAYFEKKDEFPMYESFTGWKNYAEALSRAGYNSAPRFVWQGEALSQDSGADVPFTFYGVDPTLESGVLHYADYIESGRFIESGKFEAVIGSLGAEKLKVNAGDMIEILCVIDIKDSDGTVRHINQLLSGVLVAGIINSPDPQVNGNTAFLPLDVLQDEQGMFLEGAVTELLIRKHGAPLASLPVNDESPSFIKSALVKEGVSLPSALDIYGWQDYAADYFAVSRGDDVSTRVMVLFLFVLSFLGIANTMLMSVLERTKELGMMRALGMRDGEIYQLLMWEAAFIGFIGSVFGVIIGCLVNIPMVSTGIDFGSMTKNMGGDIGYRIVSNYRSVWNPPVIAGCALCATLLSALMPVLPVRRTLRNSSISDTLRFE